VKAVIREATDADTDRLVEMAVAFIAESRYAEVIATNPGKLAALVARLLSIGTVIVAAVGAELVGMIAIARVESLFGGRDYADEVAWWVEPEHRHGRIGPRLLFAAEAWAVAQDLGSIRMVAPSGSDVGAFYERNGYEAIETTYLRRFA
jgi:GNAT superfamily N-acetyltransferase